MISFNIYMTKEAISPGRVALAAATRFKQMENSLGKKNRTMSPPEAKKAEERLARLVALYGKYDSNISKNPDVKKVFDDAFSDAENKYKSGDYRSPGILPGRFGISQRYAAAPAATPALPPASPRAPQPVPLPQEPPPPSSPPPSRPPLSSPAPQRSYAIPLALAAGLGLAAGAYTLRTHLQNKREEEERKRQRERPE